MDQFSFSSALTHFRNTQGPPGFLWKYVLGYIVGGVIFLGIYIAAGSTLVPGLVEASNDPYAVETFFSQSLGNILLFYVIVATAGVIFMTMFEASALRHYVRREGFSIRLSSDEFRLMALYLLWALTIFLVYFCVAMPFGIVAAMVMALVGSDGQMFMLPIFILLPIVVYCVLIWVIVRLSPAAAITIRDRKLTFISARKATKGRFWPLFGAFLVLTVVTYLILIIVVAVSLAFGIGLAGTAPGVLQGDPDAIAALMSNPVIWILSAIGFAVFSTLQAVFYFAFVGIPARAAVTDPNWNNYEETADTFS